MVATPAKMEEHVNQAMEMLSPANVNPDSQETNVRLVSKNGDDCNTDRGADRIINKDFFVIPTVTIK